MKVLILIISFCIVSASFAVEVETQCLAMNENREKIIKVKPVSEMKKGSTRQ